MLQDALQFFRSDFIFPSSPASKKKHKILTMTEPPPPPRSPDCASHEVTQDSLPLQGDDNDPLSYLPDDGFDDWSTADTARIVAMTGCIDNRLKSCIVAASALDAWRDGARHRSHLHTAAHPVR